MDININKVLEENEALKKALHKKEQKEQYHRELLELVFEDVRVMKSNNKVFVKKILSVIEDFEANDEQLENDLTEKIFKLYKANIDENADSEIFRIFETKEEVESENNNSLITDLDEILKNLDNDEDATIVVSV